MNITAVLETFTESPYMSLVVVVVLLLGGAWILVGSAQRRRD